MNKITLSLTLLASGASAFAASTSYYLGYGDALVANLNGSVVGAQVSPNFNIPAGLPCRLKLFVQNNLGTHQYFSAGSAMLALDQAVCGATNFANKAAFDAARIAGKLTSFANQAQFAAVHVVDSLGQNGGINPVSLIGMSSPVYTGMVGPGVTQRPIGVWAAFGFGVGFRLDLAPNSATELLSYQLSNSMAVNGTSTDLAIVDIAGATHRSTFLVPGDDNSVHYGVRAVPVPEPGALLGIAAGLAAVLLRRRPCRRRALASAATGGLALGAVAIAPAQVTGQLSDSISGPNMIYAQTSNSIGVRLELCQGTTHIGTFNGTVAASGSFSVAGVPNGTYDIHVKGGTFLSTKVTTVTILGGAANLGTLTVIGGDIDGDDAITILDYGHLSNNFDTTSSDPGWTIPGTFDSLAPETCDLDGDGGVTVFDYFYVANNFDQFGSFYYGC